MIFRNVVIVIFQMWVAIGK